MSVGLSPPIVVLPVKGIRLSSVCANIYAKKRTDLTLIELSEGSHVSAVFTRNLFCAAPVQVAKLHLQEYKPRYCLINAGNANAGTGEQGIKNTRSATFFNRSDW
jgi:glutamate N-acetyltransferase/amino-acid N-acetyltransferase